MTFLPPPLSPCLAATLLGLGMLLIPPAANAQPFISAHAANLDWEERGPGIERVLLLGDPSKAGPFVYRIRVPAGFTSPWHLHSADLNSTIISGELRFEFPPDSPLDDQRLRPQSFVAIQTGIVHRETAVTAVEMEVRGLGPVSTEAVELVEAAP